MKKYKMFIMTPNSVILRREGIVGTLNEVYMTGRLKFVGFKCSTFTPASLSILN